MNGRTPTQRPKPLYLVTLACGHDSWHSDYAMSGMSRCPTCQKLVGVSFEEVHRG